MAKKKPRKKPVKRKRKKLPDHIDKLIQYGLAVEVENPDDPDDPFIVATEAFHLMMAADAKGEGH
jgi:hypothetical protein